MTPQTHEATVEQFDKLRQFSSRSQRQRRLRRTHRPARFRADTTGAAIANAKITVRNEETGASRTTTTNAQGLYRFDNIQAGNSALFVDAQGFRRFQLTSFYLGVDRMNEIDARLEVGIVRKPSKSLRARPR